MAEVPLEPAIPRQNGQYDYINENTPLIREESFGPHIPQENNHDSIKRKKSGADKQLSVDLDVSCEKGVSSRGQFAESKNRYRRTNSCTEIPEELIKAQKPCCPTTIKVLLIAIFVLLVVAGLIMAAALVAYEPLYHHIIFNVTTTKNSSLQKL